MKWYLVIVIFFVLYVCVMRIMIEKKNLHNFGQFNQGFGREKDENHADLCLRSIVFSFESGRL